MLKFLCNILFQFRGCFSRKATFKWFLIVIAGFISRTDQLGVTSILRGLLLPPSTYEKVLNFFHSSAWSVDEILKKWWHVVVESEVIAEVNNKLVLLADHTKISKEGRKMPAVATLHQESETSSKPSFFRGHFWGTVSLLIGNHGELFSTPMSSSIHQKLNLKDIQEDKVPSTEQIVRMALEIIEEVGRNAYLVLDAFFSAGPVFTTAKQHKGLTCLTIITRAKSNAKGYLPLVIKKKGKRGRGAPRKYGKKINIYKMFQYWSRRFETKTANIYGNEEEIRYYKHPLLWMPLKSDVLFVWAETSRGRIVVMCSDVNEDPVRVIELYCKRAKIETFFSIFKNVFGGHQYHFWSKYLSPNSRAPKKNKNKKKKKNYSSDPEKTKVTYEAIIKFFNLQAITIGILQLMSIKFPELVITNSKTWLRTMSYKKPSEYLAKTAMKNIIFNSIIKMSQNTIIQLIREKQKEPDFDENFNKVA